MKYTVSEVEHLSIEEIIHCIDQRSIETGRTPVEPGLTNVSKVERVESEDYIVEEGYVTFDIRFALLYNELSLKIILNVEAQKNTDRNKLGYHLENRIIYYLSRLISSQKGKEFFHSDYDNIKKVYSIWICMDAENGREGIGKISFQADSLYGKPMFFSELDKMCAIVIKIRKDEVGETSKSALIAMLEDMLSAQKAEIKKRILEHRYGLIMTTELGRRIDDMCNLSTVVEERGIEKGIEKGIVSLVKTLKELGQTNEYIISVIVREFSLSEVQAERYL